MIWFRILLFILNIDFIFNSSTEFLLKKKNRLICFYFVNLLPKHTQLMKNKFIISLVFPISILFPALVEPKVSEIHL